MCRRRGRRSTTGMSQPAVSRSWRSPGGEGVATCSVSIPWRPRFDRRSGALLPALGLRRVGQGLGRMEARRTGRDEWSAIRGDSPQPPKQRSEPDAASGIVERRAVSPVAGMARCRSCCAPRSFRLSCGSGCSVSSRIAFLRLSAWVSAFVLRLAHPGRVLAAVGLPTPWGVVCTSGLLGIRLTSSSRPVVATIPGHRRAHPEVVAPGTAADLPEPAGRRRFLKHPWPALCISVGGRCAVRPGAWVGAEEGAERVAHLAFRLASGGRTATAAPVGLRVLGRWSPRTSTTTRWRPSTWLSSNSSSTIGCKCMSHLPGSTSMVSNQAGSG